MLPLSSSELLRLIGTNKKVKPHPLFLKDTESVDNGDEYYIISIDLFSQFVGIIDYSVYFSKNKNTTKENAEGILLINRDGYFCSNGCNIPLFILADSYNDANKCEKCGRQMKETIVLLNKYPYCPKCDFNKES